MATDYMVWLQTTWYGYRLHGMATDYMVWLQTTWYGYRLHGMATDYMVWLQTAWYGYRLHGMATDYMVWLQTTWYGYRLLTSCTLCSDLCVSAPGTWNKTTDIVQTDNKTPVSYIICINITQCYRMEYQYHISHHVPYFPVASFMKPPRKFSMLIWLSY